MYLFGLFKTAVRALFTNLGRSLLTILGIVIGIVAIVLVIALGQGAQQLILGEIEGIGANTVILRPGRQPSGPSSAAETLLSDSIKDRDIQALRKKENVPGALAVHPSVLVPGSISRLEKIYRPMSIGWTGEAMEDVFNIYPEEGEYFTEDDVQRRAKVVVLGAKVKEELFGESDAIGEYIKMKNQSLRVVGILPKQGQVSFMNVDELVLLPYSTAQRDLLGIDFFHEIFIRSADDADPDQVAEDITATLRDSHGITDPDKDDFFVVTQEDTLEMISTITNALTLFLVAVSSISLVVGGIGIMNIMLVSVTERTKEIGLRKAIGATNRDIMMQFLLEEIVLTFGGGVIGTTMAVVLSALVSLIAQEYYNLAWPFNLPFSAIALGVGVSTTIGLIFGLFPARKAAKMDPIEALRYE